MKHVSSPLPTDVYYWEKWKHHCLKLIIAIAGLTNGIVWSLVAGLCDHPVLAIWLVLLAVFSTFVTVIEYRAACHYHARWLRASFDRPLIDTNHTNQ